MRGIKYVLIAVCLLSSGISYSQEYKRDTRTTAQKEDSYNFYQAEQISKTELLQALELAGVRVFKISLAPFNKVYNLAINVDEYKAGKKIRTENVSISEDNTYSHYIGSPGKEKRYIDYIDYIKVMAKEKDSMATLTVSTYVGSRGGIILKKKLPTKMPFIIGGVIKILNGC